MTKSKRTLTARHRIGSSRNHFPLNLSATSFALGLNCFCSVLMLLATSGLAAPAQPKPLLALHAHNDYEHQRPLLDALEHHFCSIEADIYLIDGKLLVAHERKQASPERTLESLYLEPLRERVLKGRGRVYPGGPEVTLLIDIKTDWKTTYPVLRKALQNYTDILTTFGGSVKRTNAILAIITGNRSKEMFAGETDRFAALDGELADLDSGLPSTLIPWISSNWGGIFTWRGSGSLPDEERLKLTAIVQKAHRQGRRVRFWGAPDFPAFWRELIENGVDLINTDDLAGAEKFLRQRADQTKQ